MKPHGILKKHLLKKVLLLLMVFVLGFGTDGCSEPPKIDFSNLKTTSPRILTYRKQLPNLELDEEKFVLLSATSFFVGRKDWRISGKWTNWSTFRSPPRSRLPLLTQRHSGLRDPLPAAAWNDLTGVHRILALYYAGSKSGGDVQIGIPGWVRTQFQIDQRNSAPPGEVVPTTAIQWLDGAAVRLRLFGPQFPAPFQVGPGPGSFGATNSLHRLALDGQNWSLNNLGTPPGTKGVIVGHNSSLRDDVNGTEHVYVAVDGQLPNDPPRLFQHSGGWNDLGTYELNRVNPNDPRERIFRMRAPTALGWADGNVFNVTVFVVGLTRSESPGGTQFSWNLYSRSHDGNRWKDWVKYPSVPGTGSGTDLDTVSRDGFNITSGVVYKEGSITKIHVFGYTDIEGKFVRYSWSNSPVPTISTAALDIDELGPPSADRFSTISSATLTYRLTGADHRYISVVGKGDKLIIWERYLDTGLSNNWEWRKHE